MVIPDRRCAVCKRLVFTRREVSEGNIKIDIKRHAIAHCDSSPTCNWCVGCHRSKLVECGVQTAEPPAPA